ncbi:MAG: single-stranded DNA-binding protein [Armatimonadia bacterium]|nr:single-stranded DNA-binding protein [Armatimonadia bacterium]
MVNSVVLVGRLGRDPELKVTSGGISLCKFSIAVDRPYRSQGGDKVTDWLDIVAWRDRAEFCANYLQKGTMVAVEGRIQVRKWETPEGDPRKMYEIQADNVQILVGGSRSGGGPDYSDDDAPPSSQGSGSSGSKARESLGGDDFDDTFDPSDDDDPFGGE